MAMFKIVGAINYLLVVFLNAFTDLGHKIIIQNTIFKVYDGQTQIILTAIVNALILLPFVLMFSPSGFLADKFPKNTIMRYSSILAVIITLLITISYNNGWFYVAFGLTFILALQSAIYAPAKYGYIKELFGVKHITEGNGAVQAVTTIAILGGILFYTVLFENLLADRFTTSSEILKAIAPLGWLLVLGSFIELILAYQLPNRMSYKCRKMFEFNRYVRGEYLYKNIKIMTRKKEIINSIITLSLFWSISQVILAIFGEYAKTNLGITNAITVQGIMALAVIGIVVGSILASKFSTHYINMGLVSIGAVGITVIVFFIPSVESVTLLSVMFALFGIFSGLVLVPLNARIQFLSPRVHLGTIIAGSNFIQNIFMISFLILTTIFAYFGMNAVSLFYAMGFVAVYMIYTVYKKYEVMTYWTIVKFILMFRHKYKFVGVDNIPTSHGVLLLGNHVSWIDWLILQVPIRRPINYMMEKEIYNWKFFHYFFKIGQAIPVSKKASKDAFKEAHHRLQEQHVVGLYPEGGITYDGKLSKFHRGYELIQKDYNGVIVPFFIDGVFGSVFSRHKRKENRSFFKRREITVYFGEPLPKETTAEELQAIIQKMKDKYEK